MATLRHCQFVDRLKAKSRVYKGCNVKEVTEEFTSKTCSSCGNLNETLGKNTIFQCATCDIRIGRDINAAKNIMLKYMSESNLALRPSS